MKSTMKNNHYNSQHYQNVGLDTSTNETHVNNTLYNLKSHWSAQYKVLVLQQTK